MGPTGADKARALALAVKRLCPHCNQAITLADAIAMIQGGGYVRCVQVELEDGRVVALETADVNPQTMKVLRDV